MDSIELQNLISGGESSRVQLKENVTNAVSVSQEMVAFANSKGGLLIIGVEDKQGEITGLSFQDLQRINNLLTTAANDHVKSPLIIATETVDVKGKKVIVASIPEGTDKPYTDKDGLIFLKNGSDKRKVTSKEELSRLLQSSGNLYAEEMPVRNSSFDDVNWEKFQTFCEKKYGEEFRPEEKERLLDNLYLTKDSKLNIAGALLFGKNMQRLLPGFFITAIWFWGDSVADTDYRSSENIAGTLDEQYRKGFDFVMSKLQKVQRGQSFNSLGIPEIPPLVITELLVNALIHRDYFIQDTIKLFVFQNRIEIISPGKLPNNLTEAQIRRGIRKKRNNILDSLAPDLLEYRGAGSGIVRAIQAYPAIEFFNDTEAEQFTAIIHRK